MNGIIMLPNELGAALLILLGAIVLDAIFAILIHVKLGDFEWRKTTQFLITGVLPYVGGIGALAVLAWLVGAFFIEVFFALGAIVALKYSAEIISKIKQLFGLLKK